MFMTCRDGSILLGDLLRDITGGLVDLVALNKKNLNQKEFQLKKIYFEFKTLSSRYINISGKNLSSVYWWRGGRERIEL